MTREPDATRKPALLDQIIEYLLDKPLASVSFRTLAQALEVSTFTLVYHFGSRAELLSEIVWAISARQEGIRARLTEETKTLDSYFAGLEFSWQWSIQPRNRHLQRLEFEASMMEAQDPEIYSFTRSLFASWHDIGVVALESLGLSKSDADAEARLTVGTFFGLQYDLVVNHDVESASAGFERYLINHRMRLEQLGARDAVR